MGRHEEGHSRWLAANHGVDEVDSARQRGPAGVARRRGADEAVIYAGDDHEFGAQTLGLHGGVLGLSRQLRPLRFCRPLLSD